MMQFKSFLSFILIFIPVLLIAQEFQFTAKASKNTLGINQRVKVEFSVNQNGADNFRAPNFQGFRVVAGPSTSVSQSWINGKTTYSMSYVYFLEPTAKGNYTIPGASITFQGKEYKTNALKFEVTGKVEDPNDPQIAIANTAQENIFLAAFVSKENPYVGESIYVEYRLYFSNKIEFNNPQFGDMPKYEGFWNQEIPITNYDRQVGDYKGEKLNYFTLKKTVLIPQKSGKLKIDPIDMDVVVGVPTGKYDFFGYPLIQRVNQHYTSGGRTVNIKPLPDNGKPADFTGAVGDYKFSVQTNKNTLGANESADVSVRVEGIGNTKLFELPKLQVPAELEVYAPERKENLTTTLNGLSGLLSDHYSIVANYKGKYVIPGLSFSYFNPKEGKYHTLTSDELVIEVTEGSIANATQNLPNQQKVQTKGGDFQYIASTTQLEPSKMYDFYGSSLRFGLTALPFAIVPLFILVGRKRRDRMADVLGNKKREADRLAKKYLSEARKHIGNKEQFYEALEKALHNFLKAKINIETIDMSEIKIAQLLRDRNVSETGVDAFIQVLKDCNFARFTPMVRGSMEAELDKAAQVIQQVNTELK